MTRVIRVLMGAAALASALAVAAPAMAADLGGDCCADLEERIAELEATTARKGNRKVSLTVSGEVNHMVLFWDDGDESNAYIVANNNAEPFINFAGDAEIGRGWKGGYEIEIQLQQNLSGSVSQDDDDGGGDFFVWKSYVYLENSTLGRFGIGQQSRATDGVPESDLSEASVAGYAGAQDINASFFLRRGDNALSGVTWGLLIDHFNADTANVIRYDTPSLMGFVFSATWGEDDIWDVALSYTKEKGDIQIAAAIGYTEVTDNADADFGGPDQSTLVGSASVLHEPSGLNLTVAAGVRDFDQAVLDADGVLRTPDEAKYVYGKLGWIAKFNPLGNTAFYGEYGRFEDYLTAFTDDGTVVGSLAFGGFDCVAAGCRITGSEADVWGLGVVQHIDAAAMEVYLGYRRYSADFDLVDGAGARVQDVEVEDFESVIAGSKIAF